MTKEEIAQKYMEFQLLNQQVQQSQQQLQMISQQVMELKILSKNVTEISSSEEGSEMYSNLGVGVHLKSSIKDIKYLLVNVGAGIFVKKTPEETTEIVDKQVAELDKYIQNMETNLNKNMERAEILKEEISEAQKNQK